MANADIANGFTPVRTKGGVEPRTTHYFVHSSETIEIGDAVLLSGGFLTIGLAGSTSLLGVAAEAVDVASTDPTDRDRLMVYDDPEQQFKGQASGSYTEQTDGVITADIEGATGVMEINENATSTEVVKILGRIPTADNADGANANLLFKINKHQLDGE